MAGLCPALLMAGTLCTTKHCSQAQNKDKVPSPVSASVNPSTLTMIWLPQLLHKVFTSSSSCSSCGVFGRAGAACSRHGRHGSQ